MLTLTLETWSVSIFLLSVRLYTVWGLWENPRRGVKTDGCQTHDALRRFPVRAPRRISGAPRRDPAATGRLVASPLFKSSRHYPALLRQVVEQTLEGHAPQLKERALGIEVFGRDPAYDTNLDPVVRTSACEVRKRIAMYYHEPAGNPKSASTCPRDPTSPIFIFPEPRPRTPSPYCIPDPSLPSRRPLPPKPVAARRLRQSAASSGCRSRSSSASAVAGLRPTTSSLEQFWGPVWNASIPWSSASAAAPAWSSAQEAAAPDRRAHRQRHHAPRPHRVFRFAMTMARIVSVIREHKKKFDVRRRASLTLTDLRSHPAILIGAFNNEWTLRLEKDLRFTFERASASGPDAYPRSRRRYQRRLERGRHAALHATPRRLRDRVARGRSADREDRRHRRRHDQGRYHAAGEFVTQEKYLDALAARAPRGWERKNVQAVLATELVNGVPGPPRILQTPLLVGCYFFFVGGGAAGGVVGGPALPSSTTSPNLMVERPSYFL